MDTSKRRMHPRMDVLLEYDIWDMMPLENTLNWLKPKAAHTAPCSYSIRSIMNRCANAEIQWFRRAIVLFWAAILVLQHCDSRSVVPVINRLVRPKDMKRKLDLSDAGEIKFTNCAIHRNALPCWTLKPLAWRRYKRYLTSKAILWVQTLRNPLKYNKQVIGIRNAMCGNPDWCGSTDINMRNVPIDWATPAVWFNIEYAAPKTIHFTSKWHKSYHNYQVHN